MKITNIHLTFMSFRYCKNTKVTKREVNKNKYCCHGRLITDVIDNNSVMSSRNLKLGFSYIKDVIRTATIVIQPLWDDVAF